MKPPVHDVKRLIVGLLTVGSLAMSLHSAPAHAAASRDATETACTTNAWPNLPPLDFGRVTPGSMSGGTESFVVPGGGSVSASVADGSAIFRVGSIETDTVTKQRVADDPGEMPPGYHGPRFHFETVCTLDTSVDGSGPITAKPGEMVQIHMVGSQTTPDIAPTGTLAVSVDSATQQVPISMFVGGIKASLDSGSLHIPQGRSGDVAVTVTSLGGADTDATFNLYDAVPGITVANPTVHVLAGQTVHASLHVVVSRGGPLGDHNFNLAVYAFQDRPGQEQQSIGLGSLTITVDPLPVQQFTIPLGVAKMVWDSARDAACERLKDLTGQEVLSAIGRTIEDPHCYLAPLQLTASQSGNQLTITGYAPGNWVDFAVTTPDGIPEYLGLDPKFTANFDVAASLTVQLPSLDGRSTLRVSSATVTIQHAYLDSHNLTGDIVEAVANAFGGGQYFHPADYALGDTSAMVSAVNTGLSQLDGALAAAPALGFTQIDFSLNPATLDLTVTLS